MWRKPQRVRITKLEEALEERKYFCSVLCLTAGSS